jgi:hypothetical protein
MQYLNCSNFLNSEDIWTLYKIKGSQKYALSGDFNGICASHKTKSVLSIKSHNRGIAEF